MKMITIRKILTLAAFAFAPLIISCSNIADKEEEFKAVLTAEESKSERAYIRVNVENTDLSSRTLLPKVEISNLVLTGKRGNGETQVLSKADTLLEMSAKQIEIQTESDTETWKFTLTAMVSGVAYSSGEVSKEIKSGGENPLSFTLEPADGATTGTLDFSLTFTGTEGVDYEVIVNDFPLSDTQKSGDTIIWKESGLTPGTHALKIEFRAKNANNSSSPLSEVLNTYKNVFLIEKGITTKAEVTNFNLNQVYSITYDGYEPTTNADVPVADALDPTDSVMTLKFSRKAGAGTDGYITLPKLSNSTMTFSGWYTSADFAEASKVAESGTAPNTVQKIKATENLSNLTLYAKWMVEATGSITTPSDDYTLELDLEDADGNAAKKFLLGETSTFIIKTTAKNKGTAVTVSADEIAWTVSLWCGATKMDDTISLLTDGNGNKTLTIPATVKYDDVYTVRVSAQYKGITHDMNFKLKGKTPVTYIGSKDPDIPYEVGDIVFTDGSSEQYVTGKVLNDEQKEEAVAIIFYKGTGVNNGSDTTTVRTLGVGLTASSFTMKWHSYSGNEPKKGAAGSLNVSVTDGNGASGYAYRNNIVEEMTGYKNGKDSRNKLGTISFDYCPPMLWVSKYAYSEDLVGEYAEGWYLGTLKEFCYLAQTIKNGKISPILTALGRKDFTNMSVWTCSRNGGWDASYYIGLGSGGFASYYANTDSRQQYAIATASSS